MTVRRALAQAGLAPADARALLGHVLGRDRAWLIAHETDGVARPDAERFFALARRRRDGEPVAYLTGEREFWGVTLGVDRSVLIPRPETETLVECALCVLPEERPVRVLDLGTGSGAIAIALASERPRAEIVAADVSPAAIAIARANVTRMKLDRIRVIQSCWYEALPGADTRFDLIASNPPYVAVGDPHLSEGDLRFEPRDALCAGPDGLDALRIILAGARDRLVPQGFVVVEHGYDQAKAVRGLMAEAGLRFVSSARDLAGIPRVAVGRAP